MTFYHHILLLALFSSTFNRNSDAVNYLGRLINTDWAEFGPHIYSKQLNTSQCWSFCFSPKYKYAGLLLGRLCFCSSDLPTPDAVCSPLNVSSVCNEYLQNSPPVVCAGDSSMTCGGQDWFDLYRVGKDDDITSCQTPLNALCSAANQGRPCQVRCEISSMISPDCVSSYTLVGTGVYASTSGVCAAALHALQLDVAEEKIVLVERRITDIENGSSLQGSWNRGLASNWASNVTDTFQFVRSDLEYNKESNFLVFYQYLGPLFDNTGYCINEGNHNRRILLVLNATNQVINSSYSTSVAVNNMLSEGYLTCVLTDGDGQIFMLNTLTVVVPKHIQDCVVSAEVLTKVMYENSINQSILFRVENSTNCQYEEMSIVKSGKVLATFRGQLTNLTFYPDTVTKADSGIYEVQGAGNKTLAVSRLLILSSDWKNSSETQCNWRGYFLAGSAKKCTCLHPYTGDRCQNQCSVGYFGLHCDYKCAAPQCTGQLICHVDPIGCHCATGWQGSKCEKMCAKGTFGPDCMFKKTCHCLNDTGCDVFFGKCDHGCAEFYYGEDCTTMGPSLSDAPYVSNATFNSATLSWRKWSKNRDAGNFEPAGYILQYGLAHDASPWLNATTNFTIFDDVISCQVSDLSTSRLYRFRVVALYNNQIQTPSPERTYYTRCSRPKKSLIDLQFESFNATQAMVSWQMPNASNWNCNSVEVQFEVTCESSDSGDVIDTIFRFDSNKTSFWATVQPYSECKVNGSLVTTTDDNQSESVVSEKIETPESVPEIMDDPEVNFLENNDTVITWQPPKQANGRLLSYKIEISEKNGNDSVQMIVPANKTDYLIKGFSNIYFPFTLSLSAATSVGYGQPVSVTVTAPTTTIATSTWTPATPPPDNSTSMWVAIGFLIFFVLILIAVIAAGAIYIRRQNQVIYRVSPSISMRANRSSSY